MKTVTATKLLNELHEASIGDASGHSLAASCARKKRCSNSNTDFRRERARGRRGSRTAAIVRSGPRAGRTRARCAPRSGRGSSAGSRCEVRGLALLLVVEVARRDVRWLVRRRDTRAWCRVATYGAKAAE